MQRDIGKLDRLFCQKGHIGYFQINNQIVGKLKEGLEQWFRLYGRSADENIHLHLNTVTINNDELVSFTSFDLQYKADKGFSIDRMTMIYDPNEKREKVTIPVKKPADLPSVDAVIKKQTKREIKENKQKRGRKR